MQAALNLRFQAPQAQFAVLCLSALTLSEASIVPPNKSLFAAILTVAPVAVGCIALRLRIARARADQRFLAPVIAETAQINPDLPF